MLLMVFTYELSETKLFNRNHKEAMQIPYNVQSNKSIIKCYYSQNKCESKQMSVGGLVGLRVTSTSGKTTASAFLTDDGSTPAISAAQKSTSFSSGAHMLQRAGYLIKELNPEEDTK